MNHLRLVLLVIALVLAGLFGWRLGNKPVGSWGNALWQTALPPTGNPASPLTQNEARARMERRFAAAGDYGRYFARLKSAFPAEYARILDNLAQKYANTDNALAAPAGIDRAFFQAARALRQTHGILAARAEAPVLQRISTVQGNVMQVLAKRDARLCVDFFYGGAEQDFFQVMSENRALATEFASAWLEAIANGRTAAINRPEPEDGDVQLFDDALVARGLSRDEIDALLENKVANPPLPDAQLCQAAITYFEALAGLAEEPRIKLMARIVALAARS